MYLYEVNRARRGTRFMVFANFGQKFVAVGREVQYLASVAAHVLFKHGPVFLAAQTIRWIRLKRSCLEFDARFGVDTAKKVDGRGLECLGANGPESEGYQPTPPVILTGILPQLPISHFGYTFIDLGCGKGATLLVASMFPFKRIIGVEFAFELYRMALRNIEKYRTTNRDPAAVEVVLEDAAAYVFPEGPLVIYLFNPFGPTVLGHVLRNLRASLALQPRDIWIVYVNPVLKEQLEECDFLSLYSEGDTVADLSAKYALYRVRHLLPIRSG